MLSEQISSLNCVQWLTRKSTTHQTKYVNMWNPFCIQLYIPSVWISYTNCMYNCYHVHFLWITIDVYKMYTKCILHFNKLLNTFCIQKLATIIFLILYTKLLQKFDKIGDTCCIHFAYVSCIHYVQFLYTICIHHFYVCALCNTTSK